MEATNFIDVHIHSFGVKASVLVLPNTPLVLSLKMIINDHGCTPAKSTLALHVQPVVNSTVKVFFAEGFLVQKTPKTNNYSHINYFL